MTTPYATLAACRAELIAEDTKQDALLRRYIYQASAKIDDLAGHRDYFAPVVKTRAPLLMASAINSASGTYQLDENLLTLTGVTLAGSALTVGTSVEAYPTDATPYTALHLMDCCGSWYDYCASGNSRLSIAGTWGFRREYATAWETVNTLSGAMTDSIASFVTTDAIDGEDSWGFAPAISACNLIRIDDEMMLVNSTNVGTKTATVKRAVNGTTAAAHDAGADIEVFYPEESVVRAITRQADFMFARRGSFEASSINDIGIITFPQDTLLEFRMTVQALQYG